MVMAGSVPQEHALARLFQRPFRPGSKRAEAAMAPGDNFGNRSDAGSTLPPGRTARGASLACRLPLTPIA
jgi:hypothetical protein